MKSEFTHWANLEAARDDSSMNLNYERLRNENDQKDLAQERPASPVLMRGMSQGSSKL